MVDASFLGVPDVGAWLFCGLAAAAFCTTFLGSVSGAAGGLVLLALMALKFPPAVLVPMHTWVQLGAAGTRAAIMWRHVLSATLLPFLAGAALGAAAGAQVFVALPIAALQAIIGGFILVLAWLPRFTRVGGERRRFAAVGFGATFIGMFVSATGTLVAPFVAGASPDRRNHVATLGALMSVVHVMKLIAFGMLGVAIAAYAPLIAAMIAAAALGNWAGSRAIAHIPEKLFRAVFKLLLTGLALRLLWSGASTVGVL